MATSAQDKVHAAHRRLRCKSSDAISALNALLAFEACSSERAQAFCDASFLHIGNLREAAALHRQLHRVLSMPAARIAAGGVAPTLLNTIREGLAKAAPRLAMQRPSDAQALVLRRCLAAGWPDQVARRMRSQTHLAAQSASVRHTIFDSLCCHTCCAQTLWRCRSFEVTLAQRQWLAHPTLYMQGKRRAVRYQACSQQEDVYVHPRSALQRAAPDFLLFQGLAASEKRTYISGATAVDPAWLPDVGGALATLSPPLREPPPAYQPRRDQVLAWHSVTYGVHSWDLPLHAGAPRTLRRVYIAWFSASTAQARHANRRGCMQPRCRTQRSARATLRRRS